jgi:pyrimidine operon attenuation protein / uracil phosphoribosyltransferase
MSQAQNKILDKLQILQKIRRIAYQIYENHYLEPEIYMAGIDGSGYILAEMICKELENISTNKVNLIKISVDKFAATQSKIDLDIDLVSLNGKVVVMVDDVLNSGRTLAFSFQPFLSQSIKKLEVAVLVNRSHKRYPVSVDYTGYELATTLSEHIHVVLDSDKMAVYLQ